MKKFIVAAVAAVALSVGIGGVASADGYRTVATKTTVTAQVVKKQSTTVVAVSDGYGHRAVAVKQTTSAAVKVQVKKSTVVTSGYRYGDGY
jgi:hypothetical protein